MWIRCLHSRQYKVDSVLNQNAIKVKRKWDVITPKRRTRRKVPVLLNNSQVSN